MSLTEVFRGTIVSRDQDSVVIGEERVTAGGKVSYYQVRLTVNPDTPNVVEVAVTSDNRTVTLRR